MAGESAAQAPGGPEWRLPYAGAAQEEAKTTGKPMLVFIGNTETCPDCKEFIKTVCVKPEFVAFAKESLICTRVLYSKDDSKDERWKKSRIFESFNIPNSHAVIIANADGKRIGELSTAPQSIAAFIAGHQDDHRQGSVRRGG